MHLMLNLFEAVVLPTGVSRRGVCNKAILHPAVLNNPHDAPRYLLFHKLCTAVFQFFQSSTHTRPEPSRHILRDLQSDLILLFPACVFDLRQWRIPACAARGDRHSGLRSARFCIGRRKFSCFRDLIFCIGASIFERMVCSGAMARQLLYGNRITSLPNPLDKFYMFSFGYFSKLAPHIELL